MYEVGDAVPLSFQVTTPQQTLVAATVTLSVVLPDGTSVTPAVTNPRVGIYTALFVPTLAGRHTVAWLATGAANRRQSDVLNVVSASDSVAILSLDEAREHINTPGDVTVDDEELRGFINAASLIVERHTRQIVARRTLVEDVVMNRSGVVLLRASPIISVTASSLDGLTPFAVTVLDGSAGIVSVPSGYGAVRFTVVAGLRVVPEDTLKAASIICAHLFTSQRVNVGPTLNGDDGQGLAGYMIPPMAAELLGGPAPNPP